jgi:spectinomycin phosphotransferase
MENLIETVKKEYRISISNIEQLNIGFDKNTTVYKLFSCNQKTFFLKIRSGDFNKACITIPFWLSTEMKFSNIINPIKTIDNKLFVKSSTCYLVLFPYIDGQSGWDNFLSKNQFFDFGKFMYNLHSINLPHKYADKIIVETYNGKYRKAVKKIVRNIRNENHDNKVIMNFFNVLQKNEKIIMEMIDYLENILKKIRNRNQKICLCHGDIHAGNILINKNNFYIVDWDTIILAPKEKDLMFIGGGIGNKWNEEKEIKHFYEGYGKELEIDQRMIKYYRCERIIQDIFEFYQQIIDVKTDDKERKLCFKLFKEQFEPNNVIDIAMKP